MGSGQDSSLQVKDFYNKTRESLNLAAINGRTGFSRNILAHSLRDGLSLIQVWGKKEIQALKVLPSNARISSFAQKTKMGIVCIIMAEGLSLFSEIEKEAKKRKIALFRSRCSRRKCREEVKKFFISKILRKITIQGGLLQVFGMGVLIRGDSGTGKSESALELISRGHRFITDDVTQVTRTKEGKLIGTATPLSRYFMEIRGLGIINIKEIFGARAIGHRAEIKLVIQLKKWREGKDYDRLGLKFPEDYKILGQKIPQIIIPVAPGRNMALLIEVASKVHRLREKGYLAPQDLTKRLNRILSIRPGERE